MSLLARFLHSSGVNVTGTDRSPSEVLLSLEANGINVWTGFQPEKTGRPDAVVFSSAVPKTDPEYTYLRSCGVPLFERFELLGALSDRFGCSICIAGTHGKTTTTAMIGKVLSDCNKKIFVHVGGECNDIGECLNTGSDYFVCEACEYKKSLLALRPDVAVILNAEMDHPDTYSDLTEIYNTFDLFLQNAKHRSIKVINADDPYYELRQKQNAPVTFGISPNATFHIANIREQGGRYGCDIEYCGKVLYTFDLSVSGRHNLYNGAACAAVCALLQIPCNVVRESISAFSGVKRRFEYKGEFSGVKIYSDYAHHPTEIAAALKTAHEVTRGNGRIWAVFQPHTFSRTKALFMDFCKALNDCDKLIIVKEYAARETIECGMSARALFGRMERKDKYYKKNVMDAAAMLIKETAPGDCVVVLGAGDVEVLCQLLVPTV